MTDTTTSWTTSGGPDELGEVTIVRVFDAPRELIFRIFLDPEHLTHFWGPTGMSTPVDRIIIEPHVGGRFLTVMVNDETGDEYPTSARFLEITEPERFSWEEDGSGLVSTSTFEDLGDGRTQITIHQEKVPPMYRSAEALAGFSTALDKLAAYLATSPAG